jgi:hypothetical protein
MANTARLTVKGITGAIAVDFDLETWRGDVLETLEEHLGGDSVLVWGRRWADALQSGVRLSEFMTRDIIALVYLGRAQADPDTSWQSVSRAIAPYTIEFLPDEEPPAAVRPVEVGVDPDLGRHVAEPAPLAPQLTDVIPSVVDAPAVPQPEDFYRTP